MKRFIFVFFVCLSSCFVAAQSVADILRIVEDNNSSLKALREEAEAEKLGQRTGIFLSDPELVFEHSWRSPSSLGDKSVYGVRQSLDVAAVLGMRSRLARSQNRMVDCRYMEARMSVLLEAELVMIDLVYCNAMLRELGVRLSHAVDIEAGQRRLMDEGEGNVLDFNNARLSLSQVRADVVRLEAEREALLVALRDLCGGREVTFDVDVFTPVSLPADFDSWLAEVEGRDPSIRLVRAGVEVSRRGLAVARADRLPRLSLGYNFEKSPGEHAGGLSVGMSIPLWSNRNRMRQARKAGEAARAAEADVVKRFYGRMRSLYLRASGLRETVSMFHVALERSDNSRLLKKALDTGEISILDYTTSIGQYYDFVDKSLAAERDYRKARAELSAVEL